MSKWLTCKHLGWTLYNASHVVDGYSIKWSVCRPDEWSSYHFPDWESNQNEENGKSSTPDGIPAELCKCGYTANSEYFCHLFKTIWTQIHADIWGTPSFLREKTGNKLLRWELLWIEKTLLV